MVHMTSEVLSYLEAFIGENGFAPSLREIQHHFGWKSHDTAQRRLQALVDEGKIERVGPRAIRLLNCGSRLLVPPDSLVISKENGKWPETLTTAMRAKGFDGDWESCYDAPEALDIIVALAEGVAAGSKQT